MMLPNKIDREGPPCPLLFRQGSLYNLTLDEINIQLRNMGKPLNTMNLDELVKNVIATEESQLMQNPSSSASSSSSSCSAASANVKLNQALSKKTIDEVWSEIVDQECGNVVNNSTTRRQVTLGETTLEEFLIRAGVLSLGNQESITNPRPLSIFDSTVLVKQQESDWLQFQMDPGGHDQHQVNIPMPIQAGMDSHFQVSNIGFENQVMDVSYLDNQLELPIALQDGDATSSDPHLAIERKRQYTEEMMEKSIQRRQRRMIKNRESAARSRARKQVDTRHHLAY